MIAWPWHRPRVAEPTAAVAAPGAELPRLGTVLVVSPDADSRRELGGWATAFSRDVTVCRSLRAATRSARRRPPELAIVDWSAVPGQLDQLGELHGGDQGRQMRVLALVARDTPEALQDALSTSVDDVLLLPATESDLRARVAVMLGRVRSESAPADEDRDPMTGLPSRGMLLDRLRRSSGRARRHAGRLLAVLFLDVDRFQHVNESLGHSRGDAFLRALAERIVNICRPTDMVARFGGDEFVVVLEDLPDVRAVTLAAERIQQQVRAPFDVDGTEVFTTVSIGIAIWGDQHRSPEELMRDADTAKARAKTMGRDRFAVFDEAMHAEVVEALELENDLRRALVREEFFPAYQPILSLEDGRIVGFEALVRWRHPTRGLLTPGHFIPAAEEMGLVIRMDRWLTEAACTQLRSWQSRFKSHGGLTMSVNISSTEFLHPDLVPQIDHILRKTGLYGRSLMLEVTESVLMENASHTAEMLALLAALNIGLSIDDFGTGYSSLAYLRRFDVDTLKIDRSFVSRMVDDEDSHEIVRTIANLAVALGKVTVAEGVETRAQLEAVRALGITRVQGNLLSPPVPAVAATELLELTADADDHIAAIFASRLRSSSKPISTSSAQRRPAPGNAS